MVIERKQYKRTGGKGKKRVYPKIFNRLKKRSWLHKLPGTYSIAKEPGLIET